MLKTSPIFDVLHPEHETAPQWRRCALELLLEDAKSSYLTVTVRRAANASPLYELFESWGFRAGIDRIFEDIMRHTFTDLATKDRRFPLMYGTSRGASDNGKSSPTLSYTLPEDITSRFREASYHERIALQAAAQTIAQREAQRRRASS